MKSYHNSSNLYGYSVKISRLSEEDGCGWVAEVPELEGCKSDGETLQEAFDNLKDAVEGWLEIAKEDNKPIPEPQLYVHQKYSGKFTLRVPRSLHRFLSKQAENEGVSLNQLVLSYISFNAGRQFSKEATKHITQLTANIEDIPEEDDRNEMIKVAKGSKESAYDNQDGII